MSGAREGLDLVSAQVSLVGAAAVAAEASLASGCYSGQLRGYRDAKRGSYLRLHGRVASLRQHQLAGGAGSRSAHFVGVLRELEAELRELEEVKAELSAPNLVTTAGGNLLLDAGLGGSAYTAAFYLGLMSSVGYAAGVSAADTMASHAGWTEAGLANAPAYSGSRKSAAFSPAAAKSKSLSSGLVFTFTSNGTVKGCFLATSPSIDATTGTLYSAGLFTGGDQPVVATNTLTVSYTASV